MKHLTEQQIKALTRQLDARTSMLATCVRDELAASDIQNYRDLAGALADTSDAALASTLIDVDTEIIDRHIIELRDIEAAHSRMKEGIYGICIDCDDAVAYERLAAYPTAKRCVRCQQQRERGYVHRATPTL